jgi:hypothetical protein
MSGNTVGQYISYLFIYRLARKSVRREGYYSSLVEFGVRIKYLV